MPFPPEAQIVMRRSHRPSGGRPAARSVLLASFGAVALMLAPTPVAYQDIAGLIIDSIDPATRWAVTLSQGPGGETTVVAPRFDEAGGTAHVELNGGSVVLEGAGDIITGAVDASAAVPDEDRIDRSWKGDLPMTVTGPPTARGFSAGSVGGDESRLEPPRNPSTMGFESSSAPLSILAIARFIGPQTDTTAVAALDPMPLPQRKPHMTQLVAASYPMRHFKPATTNRAASELIAAYAPDTSVVSQDMFAALFAVPGSKPPVPAPLRNPGDHWWAVNPLPASVFDPKQQKCLAEAIYFEARSETHRGQVAVAQVVLNRVKNPAYPATICDVVYQNRNLYNECQFSFACDGIRDVVYSIPAWKRAQKIAWDITHGLVWLDEIGTATHYHATYVRPNWASVFTKKARIGLHVFYQTVHGGWS